MRPNPYVVVEGLLGYHSEQLRDAHDIRVFLAPPEELRRTWKVTRDCTRRGYTTHEVLAELDRRERDVEAYINPQRDHADIVVSFMPSSTKDSAGQDLERLDAHMILRDTLRHPDLSPFLGPDGEGPALIRRERESLLRIPGDIDPELAAELEEAVWQRMQYASHLRAQRLGEFTVGTGAAPLRVPGAGPDAAALPPGLHQGRGGRWDRPARPAPARRHRRGLSASHLTSCASPGRRGACAPA